ncbi:hypothetical protein [Francisella sciaenopsi]|uniref:Uncharacterized protein n=1 Tax=Francisella sciaenopsi TaxID=3055034 RepID=A0ABQ6PFA6_9GAMM
MSKHNHCCNNEERKDCCKKEHENMHKCHKHNKGKCHKHKCHEFDFTLSKYDEKIFLEEKILRTEEKLAMMKRRLAELNE